SARAAAGAFARVRRLSLLLSAPLSAEDQALQSMPDASPTKWHLGHTTWFTETLVLQALHPGYTPYDARLGRVFNSYYESLGERHPRP
ncbi:DinB family protein, partial [Escherichia fergusonii]|nr:DinB family protein [Escherichia fergusonii]